MHSRYTVLRFVRLQPNKTSNAFCRHDTSWIKCKRTQAGCFHEENIMDPRLEDLQRRIDAMAKRSFSNRSVKEFSEHEPSPAFSRMMTRAKLYAQAKASEELRQARLLATCIADEFERRGLSLDAQPTH